MLVSNPRVKVRQKSESCKRLHKKIAILTKKRHPNILKKDNFVSLNA